MKIEHQPTYAYLVLPSKDKSFSNRFITDRRHNRKRLQKGESTI